MMELNMVICASTLHLLFLCSITHSSSETHGLCLLAHNNYEACGMWLIQWRRDNGCRIKLAWDDTTEETHAADVVHQQFPRFQKSLPHTHKAHSFGLGWIFNQLPHTHTLIPIRSRALNLCTLTISATITARVLELWTWYTFRHFIALQTIVNNGEMCRKQLRVEHLMWEFCL